MSSLPTPSEATRDEEAPPPPRPWYRKKRYLIPIMFVVWMVAIGAVFGDTSPPRAGDADAAVDPGSPEDRCEPADPFVMSALAEGLLDPEGMRLSRGQAVRSQDFESLWFVATSVEGAEMAEVADGTVVLWAVDRNSDDVGSIFAVDDGADQLSLWGDVAVASAPPLPSDDGAAEAVVCSQDAEAVRGILPPASPRADR